MRIKNIKILTDTTNRKAVEYESALAWERMKRGVSIVPYTDKKDIKKVFALGGDSTLLNIAHLYDFEPVVVGINCGHTGFLMNDCSPAELVELILSDKLKTYQFPLLEIETGDGKKYLAINDVFFNRNNTPHNCKVRIEVKGVVIRERLSGDGVVACTGWGSTAYYKSVCGTPFSPEEPAIGLAPIVPTPQTRFEPMKLPLLSELTITLLSPPNEIQGYYDCFTLPYFQKIKVRISKRMIKLAFPEGEDFHQRLITKMKEQEAKDERI